MPKASRLEPKALLRRVPALDNHILDNPSAVATEDARFLVLGRLEAGNPLLERRELDHDESVEVVRPFIDLIPATTRQDLAAVLGDDWRHEVGVFLVLDRIGNARTRDRAARLRSRRDRPRGLQCLTGNTRRTPSTSVTCTETPYLR